MSTVQLATQQLTFDKDFGNHHINAIAVYEMQTQQTKTENGSGQQESNELGTLNNAKNVSVKTLIGENTLLSYLGRISYDFRGKYILSAALPGWAFRLGTGKMGNLSLRFYRMEN